MHGVCRGSWLPLALLTEPARLVLHSPASTLQVTTPLCRDYGGLTKFQGRATTVRCAEGNPGVRAALNEDGAGRVLVVDAGANMRCAIIGDLLSELAEKRGWVSCTAQHPS